ncbi:MAG: hypothetical protein Q9208_004787 [Pyrenodesmia sp. 3 TL-2023]
MARTIQSARKPPEEPAPSPYPLPKKTSAKDKVTKAKKGKRGWPKGKARKVENSEDPSSSLAADSKKPVPELASVNRVSKGKKKRGWPKGKARKVGVEVEVEEEVEENVEADEALRASSGELAALNTLAIWTLPIFARSYYGLRQFAPKIDREPGQRKPQFNLKMPDKSTSTRASKAKKPVALTENPSKMTKPPQKKRGWTKEKTRNIQVEEEQPFPFMKLPLELRRHIYGLVLPNQKVEASSGGWAAMAGIPNESMNLLLVNKQVSDEARTVLYGRNSFTVLISVYKTLVLGSFTGLGLKPMQTTPSLPDIKNWQLALWTYRSNVCYMQYQDAILSACAELANIPDLQSLKLSLPCLCEYAEDSVIGSGRGSGRSGKLEDVHDMYVDILTPPNLLPFTKTVHIGTAATPGRGPEPHTLAPPDFNATTRAHVSNGKYDPPPMNTPAGLNAKQAEWLDIKKRVHVIKPELGQSMWRALGDIWEALESGSDDYF